MDTSKYVIEEIDIDECPDKAAEYKVRGIPTLIMVDDDIEIKRISGSKSVGELQSWMM
jgi:thioredoxin-like negative regulator of GroEL